MAYLIAAHDKPDQLVALLDRLLTGNDDIAVLHLDEKSPLWTRDRTRYAGHSSGRVCLVEDPVAVYWGHESQLHALRRLIGAATTLGFDYAHHISGSDWPAASRATMVADIAAAPERIAVEIVGPADAERMQGCWIDEAFWSRHDWPWLKYHLNRWQVRANRVLVPRFEKLGVARPQPYGPWLKGWQWWSAPVDVARTLTAELATLEASGRLAMTACSDEHVVPTILARQYPDRIAPYRRFIRWDAGASSPAVLTTADFDAIRTADAWFMRKCDASVDSFFLTNF